MNRMSPMASIYFENDRNIKCTSPFTPSRPSFPANQKQQFIIPVAMVANYFLIYNAALMSMVTRTPYRVGSLGCRLHDAVVYYFVKYTPVDYKIYTLYQLMSV